MTATTYRIEVREGRVALIFFGPKNENCHAILEAPLAQALLANLTHALADVAAEAPVEWPESIDI